MNRFILALAAVALLVSPAAAGRRCYRTYQTLYSTAGWSHGSGCYSCHPRKSQARDPKELLSGLAAKLHGDAEWYREFHALTGARGGYAAAGMPGYQTSVTGEYSSYPVQGNTLLGVQALQAGHPLLDLNAQANTLGKVIEQTTTGGQNLIAGYGNYATSVYAMENDRQAKVAAYQAILGVHQGPAVAARAEVFKYQATTEPGVQAAPGQPQQQHPGLTVLGQKCIDCHSPSGQFGVHGTFDMTKLDLAMVQAAADRVSLPDGDEKKMPRAKTESGFGHGPALTWQEIRAIQDLALGVK